MEMVSVISSNVAQVGYDVATSSVYVRFLNNALYRYYDVPEFVYQELLTAPSVGSFLNRNFKNVYAYERVE